MEGRLKKNVFAMVLSAFLVLIPLAACAADIEMDLLVNMLVENGSLTREQAEKLAQKAKEKAAEQEKEKALEQQKAAEQEKARAAEYEKAISQLKAVAAGKLSGEMKTYEIFAKPMEASWKNGLRFKTADDNFTVKIGGRIYSDMLYTQGPSSLTDIIRPEGDFNRRNDRAFIRSARLQVDGTIFKDYFYRFEYEFTGDINTKPKVEGLRDVYLGMKDIPLVGRFTVGHMKEPFSLEELESHNDTTFLERSLANALAPEWSWGAAIQNSWFNDRLTFSLGAFRNSTSSGDTASGNEWNLTTRATCLPWYGGDDKLTHLGASYSLRFPESGGWNNTDNLIRFRHRPELYDRDYIVDTDDFMINMDNRLGLEAAAVYGPFSIQGEVIQTWLDTPNGFSDTGYLYGGYGYISYIITGEHREYDKKSGVFKSVTPKNIFSIKDGTWGAWEVAARCSYLCLDSKNVGISGGTALDTTIGLNWYLNPNMRLMFNFVHSNRICYGAIDGVQLRAQVDF
jgi:phosphate-selective porin OprO/OprP